MHTAAIGALIPVARSAVAAGAEGASAAARLSVDKAREAAREFEALLTSEMLKQSRQTLDKDGGFFAGDKGDSFGSLFDFFLGKHLAENGSVGLADALKRHLSAEQHR